MKQLAILLLSVCCSAQTFNNHDPLNVQDFGASFVYTNSALAGNDSYAGMQAAIDMAGTATASKSIFCPSGQTINGGYLISKPLLIHNPNVKLYGEGDNGCPINSKYFHGFSIIVGHGTAEGSPAPQLAAPMLIGTGNSYVFQPGYYLRLRTDSDTLEGMNGLSEFTVETTLQRSDNLTRSESILGSYGGRDNSDNLSGFFLSWYLSNNQLVTRTRVGGTVYILNGGIIPTTTPTHLALVLHAGTLSLYVNGALTSSAVAAGTFVLNPREDITLNLDPTYFPTGGNLFNQFGGQIDSLRFSNIARYTAPFTPPTSEFMRDSNSLLLCNFDGDFNIFAKCDTNDAWPVYMPLRKIGGATGVYGISLSEISMTYGGLLIMGATNSRFENIQLQVCDVCVWLDGGLTYENYFSHLILGTGFHPRFGVIGAAAGGITTFTKTHIQTNAPFPFIYYIGSLNLQQVDVVPAQGVAYDMYLDGSQGIGLMTVTSVGTSIDNEVADTAYVSDLGLRAVNFIDSGSTWGNSHAAVPVVQVFGGFSKATNSTFMGDTFIVNQSSPSVFGVTGILQNPLWIVNSLQYNNTTVPWSNQVGTIAIPQVQIQ